jgi:hypothetical protein
MEQSAARHYFNPQLETLSPDCAPLCYIYVLENMSPHERVVMHSPLSASEPSSRHHVDDTTQPWLLYCELLANLAHRVVACRPLQQG